MDSAIVVDPLIRTLGTLGSMCDPILIAGLGGADGQTGAATVEYLAEHWEARPIAELDPDDFYDFTVARPDVRIVDGERVVDWPRVQFWLARPEGADRDVVLMAGREPHFRWRRFAEAVADVAQTLEVTQVVVVGAYAAAVPHTRPAPAILIGDGHAFAARAGIEAAPARYQGPATSGMALAAGLREAGLRTATLSAIAPFYIGADPSPHAVLALLDAIDRGLGTQTPTLLAEEHRRTVDDHVRVAIRTSGEMAHLVANLERQYDESAAAGMPLLGAPALRTEDVLADVEALLRRGDGEAGGSGPGPSFRSR